MVGAIRCEGGGLLQSTGELFCPKAERAIRDIASDLGEIVGGEVGGTFGTISLESPSYPNRALMIYS